MALKNLKPFEIIFEDQHLIVLEKSPGLLSQGDISGEPSLVDLLRTHFGRNYVGLIHRLDRNTSGLMVVAKRSKSAERLTEQLQKGILTRKYRAILEGTLSSPQHWTHFLLKQESTNEVRVVAENTPGAKRAQLKVTPLQCFEIENFPVTLAEFELETGRSHQIRVQSSAMNHALIGDPKYGTTEGKKRFHRPALHSSMIEFDHPISREKLQFESTQAFDWKSLKP